MKIARSSGILLHPTSLPGRFGIGDLGPECCHFLDFLAEAKQKIWHVLPLGPTGRENSPYQCRSTFAGNPLLISPEKLAERGYLQPRDLCGIPNFPSQRVDFLAVRKFKLQLLRKAFAGFTPETQYSKFAKSQAWWLDPFALFMALHEANGDVPWTQFDPKKKPREEATRFHKFVQFEFFRQWQQVIAHCARRQLRIMGDMPFYVQHDSADVWHSPQFFNLHANGQARTVGGVPPDYFSQTGQLWGDPTYRWNCLKKTNFRWWVDRFRSAFERVDLLRVDHFRGFVKYWSVPSQHRTARNGRWEKGPGFDLFARIRKELGDLPLIAENLGLITPAVEQLRNELGLPGMVVLQFAFGDDGTHRPHNYQRELVSFTGTHDNNTTQGWWDELQRTARSNPRSQARAELERARAYLQTSGRDISWSFIQSVMTSIADISMIPLQDVLALGSKSRMNVPGRASGNWGWRFERKDITPSIAERLGTLTEVSGR